jgi:hypothetical protein
MQHISTYNSPPTKYLKLLSFFGPKFLVMILHYMLEPTEIHLTSLLYGAERGCFKA